MQLFFMYNGQSKLPVEPSVPANL